MAKKKITEPTAYDYHKKHPKAGYIVLTHNDSKSSILTDMKTFMKMGDDGWLKGKARIDYENNLLKMQKRGKDTGI